MPRASPCPHPSRQEIPAPGRNMFDGSSIIVGLEIGTSKVCAIVGELSPEGALNIVGLGQARSRGVRKGEIVDASLAEEDVRRAISAAREICEAVVLAVIKNAPTIYLPAPLLVIRAILQHFLLYSLDGI